MAWGIAQSRIRQPGSYTFQQQHRVHRKRFRLRAADEFGLEGRGEAMRSRSGDYQPKPDDKFSFGLWTLGNRGRDPFGDAVRPSMPPTQIVSVLGEVGAWGVNLHDNDLVPIDATQAESERIVREFKRACKENGIVVPMATVSLFFHPVFRDGAFTANDPEVRAYALQKTMRAMDLGAELGAKIFVLWGGREGVETDACRRVDDALKRLREAVNYLCEYNLASGYGYKFALEAKPNEPRGDIYMATTGHYLGFIPTLDHPEMVGVNPEFAHEQMSGLNFTHSVAQAWDAGKLFHIDLNDQMPGRYDQDLRFGSANLKAAFWLVKFLEDVGYDGPRHFDAHAYRTENYDGVKDFARGCMRTYLILKEKAARWNGDQEIQAILKEISANGNGSPEPGKFSRKNSTSLLAYQFNKEAILKKRLPYELLDQMTVDLLLGVR
jgi:xylose isomerase